MSPQGGRKAGPHRRLNSGAREMKRGLNRASTLPAPPLERPQKTCEANKIVSAVQRRPPQRSTTQANMDPVAENGQAVTCPVTPCDLAADVCSKASATASVVVVARIRPKLPKEDKEPDGRAPGKARW